VAGEMKIFGYSTNVTHKDPKIRDSKTENYGRLSFTGIPFNCSDAANPTP
jgi:hypothetical protein